MSSMFGTPMSPSVILQASPAIPSMAESFYKQIASNEMLKSSKDFLRHY